jgi:hypothetical protein
LKPGRPGLALLALPIVLASAACGGSSASSAADPYIARAADDEEREGLTAARDDIDAEMRAAVAGRDAEIERLRKQNEELKARLAAKKKR